MEEKKIHIIYGKKEWYLPIDDIIFVKADGNYSDIYTTNPIKIKYPRAVPESFFLFLSVPANLAFTEEVIVASIIFTSFLVLEPANNAGSVSFLIKKLLVYCPALAAASSMESSLAFFARSSMLSFDISTNSSSVYGS